MVKAVDGVVDGLEQLPAGYDPRKMPLTVDHRQKGLVDQEVEILLHVVGVGNRRNIRLHNIPDPVAVKVLDVDLGRFN